MKEGMKKVLISPKSIIDEGTLITDNFSQIPHCLQTVSNSSWEQVKNRADEYDAFIVYLGEYPESVIRKAHNWGLPPEKTVFFAPKGNPLYRESLQKLAENHGFNKSINYCDDFTSIAFDIVFLNEGQSCH